MGKPRGFLEVERRDRGYAPVADRVKHWREFTEKPGPDAVAEQASRCMDCGIPFCHSGCPVNNLIPDWNDLAYRQDWQAAIERLHQTNNFPEITGRICPAPCEAACTLNITDQPVTIKSIEAEIADRAWLEGWVRPQGASRGSGKRIAIVGSGPAGLACAQQLARMGHAPTVFEKADRIGGLLRYGIPDFKLDKSIIDRRIEQMEVEGVIFRTGMEIGVTVSVDRLLDDYHVLVLAGGAEQPRDLPVAGRELGGIHFAMDFLAQQNKRNAGDGEDRAAPHGPISALGKHVVVIGGGDTGSDCIGTSFRQGAASVTQLEIMPQPPLHENKALTWPDWPMKLRTSTSQEEGAEREFSVLTTGFVGDDDQVVALQCARSELVAGDDGRLVARPVAGTEFRIRADLVLLAMGFVGPRKAGAIESSRIELTPQGNVRATMGDYRTSRDRIFACGDMRRGQSLVVWAIREGRDCAAAVNACLTSAPKEGKVARSAHEVGNDFTISDRSTSPGSC
jgi:glutamate synthase (NADPH/NADH) small chain